MKVKKETGVAMETNQTTCGLVLRPEPRIIAAPEGEHFDVFRIHTDVDFTRILG
jgi:hypothetical protein